MKKDSIWNKKIEIPYEKQILRVTAVMVLYYFSLYLLDFLDEIKSLAMTFFVQCLMIVGLFLPIYLVYRRWSKKETIDWKYKKQYVWIIPILIAVFINFFVQCAIYYDGLDNFFSLREIPPAWVILFYLFYYFVIVGPTEEFIFRVYLQNELVDILGRFSVLAPLISAAVFGYIHMVQGNNLQVQVAFVVGLILGYAKYFFKNCTFITLVLVHALYDFILLFL